MDRSLTTALRWISALLDAEGIPRQFVGGLAARVHGARRPLVDVDLYAPDEALARIAAAAGDAVVRHPEQHVDEHWDIRFMKLEHAGWSVEVGGADSARIRDARVGSWRPAAIDFEASETHSVAGVEIPVMPRHQLVDYKRALGRAVDARDLREIDAAAGAPVIGPSPPLPALGADGLTLRTIAEGDVDALFALFGDPEVTRFWGHPALPDRAAARELLAAIEEGARTGTLLQWGIVPDGRDRLVGTCTLAAIDREHRRAELGLALGRGHRGRGHARQAARAVLRHGFDELRLHRVVADVDPRNEAALRLARDLGFRREGRLRRHYRRDEEWQDGVLFGLLESEWGGAG